MIMRSLSPTTTSVQGWSETDKISLKLPRGEGGIAAWTSDSCEPDSTRLFATVGWRSMQVFRQYVLQS